MDLFNRQLESGVTVDQIMESLDKAINVLHLGLRDYTGSQSNPGSFLSLLKAENDGLAAKLDGIRQLLLTRQLADLGPTLRQSLQSLQAVNHHYLKKENILFPILEKMHPRFSGLAIMWALQDRARQILKKVLTDFEDVDLDEDTIRIDLGQVFFVLQGLIKKENLILFPIATELLTAEDSTAMLAQCRDYEPAFMSVEEYEQFLTADTGLNSQTTSATVDLDNRFFLKTPTGNLTAAQAMQIFNALPVDLSFVDASNKVQYFTRPKDRIFPRSPAVIGRDVDRCHPPASVHIVQQIIEDFREGQRDSARFWISLHGKKILIEYFAVRDDAGTYMGTLEVSQDITEIQELTGEQRLLDWT